MPKPKKPEIVSLRGRVLSGEESVDKRKSYDAAVTLQRAQKKYEAVMRLEVIDGGKR